MCLADLLRDQSRDRLLRTKCLLAQSRVQTVEVVEETLADASLFVQLDGTLKDLVGELVTFGEVLSSDARARLVGLIDGLLVNGFVRFLVVVFGRGCHGECLSIESTAVKHEGGLRRRGLLEVNGSGTR